jgi:hypothetical protein
MMDSLILQVNPKRTAKLDESRTGNEPTGSSGTGGTNLRKERPHGRTGSRDLHSIAAELSRGKVVPVRTDSIPHNEPLSIDDILRKHASETPEIFGLSRDSLRRKQVGNIEPEVETLDNVLRTRSLMLERLESVQSNTSRRSSSSTAPSGPSHVHQSNEAGPGSDEFGTTSLTSRDSWESLKRKIERDADPQSSVAKYLRSRRLNRYITLHRPGQAGQVLSYAEVGDPRGYPVVVFLGLGCVRYLVALYDEVARAEGIRLICIDRWGLGKSQDVPAESRGLLEWANVVKEVLDRLEIHTFGILAHSAGASYALATALKLKERVVGTIHLLAPWVNMEIDGSKRFHV